MQIAGFIQSIEKEFEEVPAGTITDKTEFRKLEGWSSMMALILIAKIDSEFSITVSAEELSKCATINDLFSMVHSKAA